MPPASRLTAIILLATAWTPANLFGSGFDRDAEKDLATLGNNAGTAGRLLARPGGTSGPAGVTSPAGADA
jgi:hypothetical protein